MLRFCCSLSLILFPSTTARDCPHEGSVPAAATCEPGPPLGCPYAPAAPAWHLWTPAHRAPAPQRDHWPGDARVLPRLLLRYRCTGLRLLPLVPSELRTLGTVFDVPSHRCRPPG
jgi:hypothetical protein